MIRMVRILMFLQQFNIFAIFLIGRFVHTNKSAYFFCVVGSIPNCRGPPKFEFFKNSNLGGK